MQNTYLLKKIQFEQRHDLKECFYYYFNRKPMSTLQKQIQYLINNNKEQETQTLK